MTTYLIAALVTLAFTTVLTVAGLGAAFILVPVYLALGVSMHSAQATALLLNAIAMAFACARFIPAKLVDFRIAVPIVIVATVLSPLGAYTSSFVPVTTLKWLFVGFLVFAGAMMLFYKPIIGALIGSWLMHRKLQAAQVKTSIGVLLFFIAATMAYKLLA
jgi:uncharacterized membrane protein YfcA